MNKILPEYLCDIAEVIKEEKNEITFYIRCKCKNNYFKVFKNITKENDNSSFEDYWKRFKVPIFSYQFAIDPKNGKAYIYGKTFLGIHVGKFYKEDLHLGKARNIIKVKCSLCAEEYIIFDNRKYGYDSVIEEQLITCSDIQFSPYKMVGDSSSKILVKITNDLTYDEFVEEINDNSLNGNYSNAFTNIIIYSNDNGKTRKIFEEETA